ncbi:MAG: hypothetical protein DCC68_20850 [Planctomycetota bacterium]|nr:MAG: hypothetical protein DCC68_20850 [Planctomycetota bacterium]
MTARLSRVSAALILLVAGATALPAQDGMIGFNFLRSNGATSLGAGDVAGYIPQANWNNVSAVGSTALGTNVRITSPVAGAIVDATGTSLAGVNVQFASATTWSANNSGTPDNALMSGYIDNNGSQQTTYVRLTGIPYDHYAVIAYMGSDGNGRTGTIAVPGYPALNVNYTTNTQPFTGYLEGSNVAILEGFTDSELLLFNHRGNNNTGLHAMQIVELTGPSSLPPPVQKGPAVLGAYYSFDDPSSLMADSRNLNNGTVQGAATQGAGRFGAGSLQLANLGAVNDQFGQVAAPTVDVKPTDTLAVSVWVSRGEAADHEVVSLGDHYGLRITAAGGIHFFEDVTAVGDAWSGSTTGNLIPSDGTWHHIVAQKALTGDYFEVWVDGQLYERGAGVLHYEPRPVDYTGLGSNLVVGKHGVGASLGFAGQIDELRIFSGVLTPDQIQSLYTNNVVPEPSTWALAATALGFIAMRVRRRRA